MVVLFSFSFALCFSDLKAAGDQQRPAKGWSGGVARVIITPDQPMWMAGFAARDRVSEGKLHDLWAKALALEDADGQKAVLVTTDLLGMPKELSDRIRDRLQASMNLPRAQIILNSSHTHSGPVLRNSLVDIYGLDEDQQKKIAQYSDRLVNQIVSLVSSALKSMVPVKVYTGNGVTRFQVNRRNNNATTLLQQTEVKGPGDSAVPVIKVVNDAGDLMALAFGYACHNTTLSGYEWSGDYAGFAQLELEKVYEGTTAMFFAGAGADQNPLPRNTVALAQQYGKTLAAAVESVVSDEMRMLPAKLTTVYAEVALPISAPPSKEELSNMLEKTTGYQKRWVTRMLKQIERGESFITSYPYPVQVWKLGDQTMISLGGELVVGYANQLKQIFGQDIFVLGYSNDVMAYIPTTAILREGGYEGATSQMVYGMPGTWTPNIQTIIIEKVVQLAEQAGVRKSEKKIFEIN
ncbi:MAG: neutral/alkaline non-lysosomal ceramidase N-terminal domain-containing protein [Cyclobacteriaceae bacterium]